MTSRLRVRTRRARRAADRAADATKSPRRTAASRACRRVLPGPAPRSSLSRMVSAWSSAWWASAIVSPSRMTCRNRSYRALRAAASSPSSRGTTVACSTAIGTSSDAANSAHHALQRALSACRPWSTWIRRSARSCAARQTRQRVREHDRIHAAAESHAQRPGQQGLHFRAHGRRADGWSWADGARPGFALR